MMDKGGRKLKKSPVRHKSCSNCLAISQDKKQCTLEFRTRGKDQKYSPIMSVVDCPKPQSVMKLNVEQEKYERWKLNPFDEEVKNETK